MVCYSTVHVLEQTEHISHNIMRVTCDYVYFESMALNVPLVKPTALVCSVAVLRIFCSDDGAVVTCHSNTG